MPCQEGNRESLRCRTVSRVETLDRHCGWIRRLSKRAPWVLAPSTAPPILPPRRLSLVFALSTALGRAPRFEVLRAMLCERERPQGLQATQPAPKD